MTETTTIQTIIYGGRRIQGTTIKHVWAIESELDTDWNNEDSFLTSPDAGARYWKKHFINHATIGSMWDAKVTKTDDGISIRFGGAIPQSGGYGDEERVKAWVVEDATAATTKRTIKEQADATLDLDAILAPIQAKMLRTRNRTERAAILATVIERLS